MNPSSSRAGLPMAVMALALVADPVAGASSMLEKPPARGLPRHPAYLTACELARVRVVVAEVVRRCARRSESSSSWAAEAFDEHGQPLRRHVEVTCEELARLIYDAAEEERLAGVGLLERLGGPAAIEALEGILRRDSSDQVRLAALEALVWSQGFAQTAHILRESLGKELIPAQPQEKRSPGSPAPGQLLAELEAAVVEVADEVPAAKSPPWIPRSDPASLEQAALRVPTLLDEVVRQSVQEIQQGEIPVLPEGLFPQATPPTRVFTRFAFTAEQLRELSELGPAAIPALVTATGEPGLLGRLAWEQLMRTRGRELIPTLSGIVFEHPDPLTRLQALETLLVGTHFGAILRKLRHLAAEDGDSEVGRFARGVLAACRRPTQSSPPA